MHGTFCLEYGWLMLGKMKQPQDQNLERRQHAARQHCRIEVALQQWRPDDRGFGTHDDAVQSRIHHA